MSEKELLKRRVRFSRLYDLYGPLLTERQRRIYEMHELDDFSLSEISEALHISRQGVSDQLSKVRSRLDEIEKLLGFNAAFSRIERDVQALLADKNIDVHARSIVEACGGRITDHV
ncbi:MAG: sigma factor-like helix-turn-helix DNA-binding protein [Pyramidobacter sp.]